MIKEDGVRGYFLIVWDFIRYAREEAFRSDRAAARPPARSSPGACASPTSIRSTST